jgi:hypothetical protein
MWSRAGAISTPTEFLPPGNHFAGFYDDATMAEMSIQRELTIAVIHDDVITWAALWIAVGAKLGLINHTVACDDGASASEAGWTGLFRARGEMSIA